MDKEWSDIKKLIWLFRNALTHGATYETLTGKIVSFLTQRIAPLKIEATLEPIQDLHGQEAPWPPGGGKNLFDEATAPIYQRYFDASNWLYASDSKSYLWPCKPSTTYTISSANSSATIFRAGYLEGEIDPTGTSVIPAKNVVRYTSTSTPITFTTSENATYIAVQMNKALIEDRECKIQIEESATASSFSPYSNECPISGHTGADVYRTGKNLVNVDDAGNIDAYIDRFGTIASNSSWSTSVLIPVESGKPYILSGLVSHPNTGTDHFRTFDKFKNYISAVSKNESDYPITFNSGVAYVQFCWKKADKANVMFEQSDTASAYVPYSGTTVTITFGQTVYGCQLTVFEDGSGQIVATLKSSVLNDIQCYYNGTQKYFYTDDITDMYNGYAYNTPSEDMKVKFECFGYKDPTVGWVNLADGTFGVNGLSIRMKWSDAATVTDFKNLFGAMRFVYPLATPITIPLTPGQVNALQGQNVVWVDNSGEIKVTYRSN